MNKYNKVKSFLKENKLYNKSCISKSPSNYWKEKTTYKRHFWFKLFNKNIYYNEIIICIYVHENN